MKDVVKRDKLVLHLCGASLLVSLPIIFSPWYCPKAPSECPVLKICAVWASLVAQWLKMCLVMPGTWVQSLVWDDPLCCEGTEPVRRNC